MLGSRIRKRLFTQCRSLFGLKIATPMYYREEPVPFSTVPVDGLFFGSGV